MIQHGRTLFLFCATAVFISLFTSSCLLCTVIVRGEPPSTSVSVMPPDGSADVGQTFIINITIIDVQNLYGLEATLTWNSSVLEASNIDVRVGQGDGTLYNPVYVVENSTRQGVYTISALSMNPAPSFNGTGIITRITFRVIQMGSCTLALESELYDRPSPDGVSSPIAHMTIDGFFHVTIPEFPNAVSFSITVAVLTGAVATGSVKFISSIRASRKERLISSKAEQYRSAKRRTVKLVGDEE